jgi:hypothetical protein
MFIFPTSCLICDNLTPTGDYDCLIYSDSNNYCCYTIAIDGKKSCVSRPTATFNGDANLYCGAGIGENYPTGIVYSAQSNFTNNYDPLSLGMNSCGTTFKDRTAQLIDLSSCSDYSAAENSCCLFQKTIDTTSGSTVSAACYWIGQKYVGTAAYEKLNINCFGSYYTMSYLLAIISTLFILV